MGYPLPPIVPSRRIQFVEVNGHGDAVRLERGLRQKCPSTIGESAKKIRETIILLEASRDPSRDPLRRALTGKIQHKSDGSAVRRFLATQQTTLSQAVKRTSPVTFPDASYHDQHEA